MASLLAMYLLPLLLLVCVCDAYGLMHWGKTHQGDTTYLKKYVLTEVIVLQVLQVLLYTGTAFLGAYAAKSQLPETGQGCPLLFGEPPGRTFSFHAGPFVVVRLVLGGSVRRGWFRVGSFEQRIECGGGDG